MSTTNYLSSNNSKGGECRSINFNKTQDLKLNIAKIKPKYSSYYYPNEKEKAKPFLNGMDSTGISNSKFHTIDVNEMVANNVNTYGLATKYEDFRITNKGKSFSNCATAITKVKESVLTVKNDRSNSINYNNINSFNLNNYKIKPNENSMTKYDQKFRTIDSSAKPTIGKTAHSRSISNSISTRYEKDILEVNDRFNYLNSLTSKKHYGIVSAFSYNTHNGTSRNYNEDRVSIHLHVKNPSLLKENTKSLKDDNWPVVHFISVIDGHGGSKCADYIKDNLAKEIVKNYNFPDNIVEAIREGISNIEKDFINRIAIGNHGHLIADFSGSCLVFFLSINTDIYVINLGDSRAILYRRKNCSTEAITIDHKPDNNDELKRINNYGGQTFV